MGWEFAGKVFQPIGIIGVFASTSNQRHEIVFVTAGILADNDGLDLQALQEICGGLCPPEVTGLSRSPLNWRPRFFTPETGVLLAGASL